MSYLQRLAQVFAREVGDRISEYTFVFPNRRAGLFFRRQLGKYITKPIFSPKLMTINECFASLSHLHVADSLTLLIQLYAIYQHIRPNAEPLEQFLHWGKMMLADFSEIDNHLVKDIEALYAAVKDIHNLDEHFLHLNDQQRSAIKKFWGDFYDSPKKDNELHKQFLRTWEILYPLYAQLKEQLLEAGLAYEGLLHRHVIETWEDIPDSVFEKQYVFIGFNALTESERQLMILLRDRGIADFYFDYENERLSDPENRASLFMQKNLQLFPSHYPLAQGQENHQSKLTCISVDSTIGEAREVYRILEEIYPPNTPLQTDFTRTAVVLPDEQLLIPLLDCFPESVGKINVTMGYPLRASQLYMPIAYPEKFFTPMPNSGEEMITSLRTLLATLNTPASSEAYYLLTKVIEQVDTCMKNTPMVFFSSEAIIQILRMLTLQSTIPYAGEPLDGLQVMGVLETRALDFDNIIITGFNDEKYPGKTHNSSFIPYILRKGFNLPTPERQDAIFAYNFYRMLSYAQRVWFITNSVADEQTSGEVSRYLYQLQWQYGIDIEHITVVSPLSPPQQPITDLRKDDDIITQLENSKKKSFSASALNTYLFCQKKFYYQYVQRIHEPEQDDDIIASDATIGKVLHAVIQQLYEPYKNKTITLEDIQTIIATLNEDQWNTLPVDAIRDDYLAMQVMKNYVHNILQYDQSQAPFVYLYGEEKVNRTLSIPGIGDIHFFGYIDRIDQQQTSLRIIDYKTGKAEITYRDMAHIFDHTENQDKALQTMLYCWMLKNSHPQLFIQTSSIEPHIYPARTMASLETVETLIHQKGQSTFVYDNTTEKEFVDELIKLIQEIFDKDTPFSPTEKIHRCQSCAFFALCKG